MQSLPIVFTGFLLGMLHATDADHVVAVSTIVSQQRKLGSAARVGALWGVGHTLTVLLVGSAIILFNLVIPPRVGQVLEFFVALMLIVLGAITLARVSRYVRESMSAMLAEGVPGHRHSDQTAQPHLHVHAHGDVVHAHRHGHDPDSHGHGTMPPSWLDRHLGGLSVYQAVRPVIIGIVHGLAGSAAVALLVLAEIRAPLWAIAYLVLFGIGTMAGMMLITSLIAVPFAASHRLPYLNLALQVVAGLISLALGVYLVWYIAASSGLLAGV